MGFFNRDDEDYLMSCMEGYIARVDRDFSELQEFANNVHLKFKEMTAEIGELRTEIKALQMNNERYSLSDQLTHLEKKITEAIEARKAS